MNPQRHRLTGRAGYSDDQAVNHAADEGYRTGRRAALRGEPAQRPPRLFIGGEIQRTWWAAYRRGYDEEQAEEFARGRGGEPR